MLLIDARGVPVSTTKTASLHGFEQALRQLQAYRGDPVATIDSVLADDPGFVLGHLFRAATLVTFWEKGVLPQVRAGLDRLGELDNCAHARERSLTSALRAWAAGDWEGMRNRLDRHLAEWPRDALALQVGHVSDFYHGDRDNLRGRILRAQPFWHHDLPGYGFVLGMAAFGLEECGDYGRAEETGRRALEIEPEDGWAHHAVTHVMEMQGRQAEGIAWMESRESRWAQPDNTFAFHNWWHAALFNLDLDLIDRALAIYDEHIRPRPSQVQLEMVDAAALLWRLYLRGIDVGRRWEELAESYDATSAEAGFYAFNDMHAMMAFVATGRQAAAAQRLAAMEGAAEGAGTSAGMIRAVGLAIGRAVEAFGRGGYGEVVHLLMPVRYRAQVFGGSHAQRDIIHRTLLEAALRDNQGSLATALAAERTALKPHCPFGWQLAERARRIAAAGGVSLQ